MAEADPVQRALATTLPPKQLRVVNIELRCGCGAQTFIEWPVETNYVNYLPDLVKGFHAAHAGCHGKASP